LTRPSLGVFGGFLFFTGPYDIMVLLGDRIVSRAQRKGGRRCKED
jgi:hypothetical protein